MKDKTGTKFNIKLAGIVIGVEAMHAYVREYCKEYITDEPTLFTVRIEQDDIDAERERFKKEYLKYAADSYAEPSNVYLETLAVYRKIVERMPLYNILLFHGSAIAVDGEAYLFIAKSGTGKSTHTCLWREHFGNRAVMINDDKPLLEVTKDNVVVHGTPWDGEHRLSTNMSSPLKAVCILTRGKDNHIKEISPAEAYPMLLQQTYRLVDAVTMEQTMNLLDKILEHTRFYRLSCNMEPEAARVAVKGMKVSLF